MLKTTATCWENDRKPQIIIFIIGRMARFWNPTIYNMICWFAGRMGQSTCHPSVWHSKDFFFIFFLDLWRSQNFFFISVIFQKNRRVNWKGFCKEFCKILWKNWNIRRLVDESFVQWAQRTSISYCRLTYFWSGLVSWNGPRRCLVSDPIFLSHTSFNWSGFFRV